MGLRSSNWGGGPRSQGGEQATRAPSTRQGERCAGALWEAAPTWGMSEDLRQMEHRTAVYMPFLVTAACPQRRDADG